VADVAGHTGVRNERVLSALARVPRHRFVREEERADAYRDQALGIGHGQTISQPSMLAIMLDALGLEPSDRVLEVGAGCGYAAALLAELSAEVYAVEIVPELGARARALLAELGYDRVHVVTGNGRLGLPSEAPF
jgi:protein-L-isoaspartate(D-aspartate) O-methyltransferase